MSTVCSLDLGARETILRELKAFAERLRDELAVEAVYLFGSFARGTEHEGSDIDVLVVANFTGRSLDFIAQVTARTELPVEPLVVRPATLARRLGEGHPLFTRIMADAVPL
jgi:predicted nucleotidyltransferase